LIDYYLLGRGEYNVWDVFDVNGQYGKINWSAIMAYLVSFILEIPFMNTTLYVGPVSKALDGTDIAWIMGLAAPLALYYYPMRKKMNLSINSQDISKKLESK
jgi:nucleobase:cation symporter-1, NCS1 family